MYEVKYDQGLECPSCKGPNLHQHKVSVFWRANAESSDGYESFISTKQGREFLNKDNPSRDRDGLLIEFICEGCDADPELAIYQHKGITYFEWKSMRQLVSK